MSGDHALVRRRSKRTTNSDVSTLTVAYVLAGATILALIAPSSNVRLVVALGVGAAVCVAILVASRSSTSSDTEDAAKPLRWGTLGVLLGLCLAGLGIGNIVAATVSVAALFLVARAGRRARRFLSVVPLLTPIGVEVLANYATVDALVSALGIAGVAAIAWRASSTVADLVRIVVPALTTYLLLAIVLYLVGVRPAYTSSYFGTGQTDFGVFGERWRFPLSSSWGVVPSVGVLCLALAVVLLIQRRSRRNAGELPWALAGIATPLFVIAASNGRTFLFTSAILAVVATGVFGRVLSITIAGAMQLLWAAPWWWTTVVSAPDSWVAALLQTYVPARNRNSDGVLSLEGRDVIWRYSLDSFDQTSLGRQLTGFGPDGYIASGASAAYRFVLGSSYETKYYSPHNSTVEILLSNGTIGLGAFCLLFAIVFVVGAQQVLRQARDWRVITTLLCALPILGLTEVVLVPSNGDPTAIAIPLTIAAVFLARSNGQKDTTAPAAPLTGSAQKGMAMPKNAHAAGRRG